MEADVRKRIKVTETSQSRRAVLETLPRWTTPLIGSIPLLPGLGFVLPQPGRKVPKDVRAGWIDVRINKERVKVLFQFVGQWNFELLRNLKPARLARLIMLELHKLLMACKMQGGFQLSTYNLEFFMVKGLVFESQVGLGTDYISY